MPSSRNRSRLHSSPRDTQVSVCVGPRPRFGRGFAPRCPCRTTASRALAHRSTSRSNCGRRNSTRGHRKPPSGAPAVTEHHSERVPRGGGGDAQEPPSAHASAWQANPCSSRAPSWASILLCAGRSSALAACADFSFSSIPGARPRQAQASGLSICGSGECTPSLETI